MLTPFQVTNDEFRVTNMRISNPQSLIPKYILPAILLAYFIIGTLYAVLTPAWQAPDEPAHYNFVRQLVENHALPELTQGCYDQNLLSNLTGAKFRSGSVESICYENYQPPLYYLLAAPIFAVSGGSLLVLRLFSLALGGLSLVMIFRAAALFLSETQAAGVATFAAFVPMHLTMLASANNDSLAELLLTTFVFLLLRWMLTAQKSPIPWKIGVVLGLILLTKVTVYTAIVIGAAGLWLATPMRWQTLAKNALRLYTPALVFALPMLARNSLVYGGVDVLGLRRHDSVVVGQLRTADRLAETGWAQYLGDLVQTTFHSFWGQFGWMAVPMDSRVYFALTILTLLAVTGFGRWLWRSRPIPPKQRRALVLLTVQLLLVGGIFIGLNLSFVQFQGRYFFSGLLPLGVIFSVGMSEILRKKAAWMGALVALAASGWLTFSAGVSKWTALIGGGTAIALMARQWLPDRAVDWAMVAIFAGMAALAVASVFWFIVPNL